MATSKTTQSHFEIMMDYMERHGDIGKAAKVNKRLEHLRRWIELTELLNSSGESVKSVEKWRNVWADFKNNTKKKIERTRNHGGKGAPMSDVEMRLAKFMGYNIERIRKVSLENDSILIKSEEEDESSRKSESPPLRYVCVVDDNSKTPDSASSYTPSRSSPQPIPAKRIKSNDNEDEIHIEKRRNSNDNVDMTEIEKRRKSNDNEDLKEIANKFLDFEREKDRRSHETEMARLKQNDRLISVVGRIVNVLETLAPCFQRYLDKNVNDGG